MADGNPFEQFIRSQAKKLREGDAPPATRDEWTKRRATLRDKMFAAMGPMPEKPCELEPRVLGTIERDGYRIEKVIFQSRPDVWVTASAYVPAIADGKKAPAVLVVHGHWAFARRDPVVQARCLGLVKLGFFVLAVDAFGSGERFTNPARGTYHGALYGSTLWPTGHTLLGMQVYDNRRAVDYLLSRKEVNDKIGITGASGGGNQSMYAGAMDERIGAVVPVCSVGNFQAYLHAACCVCEVLPGALTFTEEGDVLGLVAPRSLLVMNAARDGIQFSPAEAEKSLARANDIFKVVGEPTKVKHVVFDSGHDYNKPMRETMYGWMTLHLKGEGKGEPIPEPEHKVEKPEDLACFANLGDRPKGFLTPPLFAAKVGREVVAKFDKLTPDHAEMWEATAIGKRLELKKLLGDLPKFDGVKVKFGPITSQEVGGSYRPYRLKTEAGVEIVDVFRDTPRAKEADRKVVVSFSEINENAEAKGNLPPLFTHYRLTPRGIGKSAPKAGAIAGAPDHNPAEHALWIGRPLLAQWALDTVALLRAVDGADKPLVLVGVGPASVIVLAAAAFAPNLVRTLVLVDPPASLVTDAPYASGTPMGILAPGILNVGDIPHLAAMFAPKRLIIAGGVSPQGKKLSQKELEEAFRFTTGVYKGTKVPDSVTIAAEPNWNEIVL